MRGLSESRDTERNDLERNYENKIDTVFERIQSERSDIESLVNDVAQMKEYFESRNLTGLTKKADSLLNAYQDSIMKQVAKHIEGTADEVKSGMAEINDNQITQKCEIDMKTAFMGASDAQMDAAIEAAIKDSTAAELITHTYQESVEIGKGGVEDETSIQDRHARLRKVKNKAEENSTDKEIGRLAQQARERKIAELNKKISDDNKKEAA